MAPYLLFRIVFFIVDFETAGVEPADGVEAVNVLESVEDAVEMVGVGLDSSVFWPDEEVSPFEWDDIN